MLSSRVSKHDPPSIGLQHQHSNYSPNYSAAQSNVQILHVLITCAPIKRRNQAYSEICPISVTACQKSNENYFRYLALPCINKYSNVTNSLLAPSRDKKPTNSYLGCMTILNHSKFAIMTCDYEKLSKVYFSQHLSETISGKIF